LSGIKKRIKKGTGYFSKCLKSFEAVPPTISRGVAGQIVRLCALVDEESLLLVILDDLRRANLRVLRVEPDIAKGTSLAQEIPALIQFDLDLREPLTIALGKLPLVVQSVFLCDKALNIIEDRLIPDLILHERLLSRGYDWKGNDFLLRQTQTGVNRTSSRRDVPRGQEYRDILH